MDVATLWIRRKDSDIPELICAWDGWSIEENYDGWDNACKDALEAVASDLASFRYLNISVSDKALDEHFRDYQALHPTDYGTFEGPEPRAVSNQESKP